MPKGCPTEGMLPKLLLPGVSCTECEDDVDVCRDTEGKAPPRVGTSPEKGSGVLISPTMAKLY